MPALQFSTKKVGTCEGCEGILREHQIERERIWRENLQWTEEIFAYKRELEVFNKRSLKRFGVKRVLLCCMDMPKGEFERDMVPYNRLSPFCSEALTKMVYAAPYQELKLSEKHPLYKLTCAERLLLTAVDLFKHQDQVIPDLVKARYNQGCPFELYDDSLQTNEFVYSVLDLVGAIVAREDVDIDELVEKLPSKYESFSDDLHEVRSKLDQPLHMHNGSKSDYSDFESAEDMEVDIDDRQSLSRRHQRRSHRRHSVTSGMESSSSSSHRRSRRHSEYKHRHHKSSIDDKSDEEKESGKTNSRSERRRRHSTAGFSDKERRRSRQLIDSRDASPHQLTQDERNTEENPDHESDNVDRESKQGSSHRHRRHSARSGNSTNSRRESDAEARHRSRRGSATLPTGLDEAVVLAADDDTQEITSLRNSSRRTSSRRHSYHHRLQREEQEDVVIPEPLGRARGSTLPSHGRSRYRTANYPEAEAESLHNLPVAEPLEPETDDIESTNEFESADETASQSSSHLINIDEGDDEGEELTEESILEREQDRKSKRKSRRRLSLRAVLQSTCKLHLHAEDQVANDVQHDLDNDLLSSANVTDKKKKKKKSILRQSLLSSRQQKGTLRRRNSTGSTQDSPAVPRWIKDRNGKSFRWSDQLNRYERVRFSIKQGITGPVCVAKPLAHAEDDHMTPDLDHSDL